MFGRLRTRQRQIHSRKSVHEFILRYGQWAVFIDLTETYDQVLHHFQQFDQAKFDQEYAWFLKAQRQLQVLHRFRHHPPALSKVQGVATTQEHRLWVSYIHTP